MCLPWVSEVECHLAELEHGSGDAEGSQYVAVADVIEYWLLCH